LEETKNVVTRHLSGKTVCEALATINDRDLSVIVNFQPSNANTELQKIENSTIFPVTTTVLPITLASGIVWVLLAAF
jgi:hypothetical protein